MSCFPNFCTQEAIEEHVAYVTGVYNVMNATVAVVLYHLQYFYTRNCCQRQVLSCYC